MRRKNYENYIQFFTNQFINTMRKITSLLMLLLMCVGTAVAQITDLSELVYNTKTYSVETVAGSNYRATSSGYDRSGWYSAFGASGLMSYRSAGVARDVTSVKQQFIFEKDGSENVYIYSVGAGKYLTKNNSYSATPQDAVTIVANTKYPGAFTFYFDGTHYINSNGAATISIDDWTTHDDGNGVYLTEQQDASTAIAAAVADAKQVCLTGVATFPTQIPSIFTAADVTSFQNDINAATSLAELEIIDFGAKYATFLNRSFGTYLNIGASQATRSSDATNSVIVIKPNVDGSFYLQGYITKTYLGNVAQSTAIPTTANPTVKFQAQVADGSYIGVRPTGSSNGYNFVHFGGSGVVGWEINNYASQFTIAEATIPVTVSYVVKQNDAEIWRTTKAANAGDIITEFPADLQRDYTTLSYPVASYTVTGDADQEFVANIESFTPPFTLSTDYASATWYLIRQHASYATPAVYTNGDAIVWATNGGTSYTSERLFAFMGDPYNGIKVINKAAGEGKYLTNTNPATMTTTAYGWVLKQQTADYGKTGAFGLFNTANNQYLNSQAGTLKYWGAFDQGSTLWVETTPNTPNYDALVALTQPWIEAAVDHADEYFQLSSTGTAVNDFMTALTQAQENAANNIDMTDAEYNAAVANFNAAIVKPQNGYYRLKNKQYGNYMTVTAEGKLASTTTENALAVGGDLGTIFYVTERSAGYFNFASQGLNGAVASESTQVNADGNPHGYYLRTSIPGYGYIQTASGARSCYHEDASGRIVGWGIGAEATHWTFEPVEDYTIALNTVEGKGYATTYLPFAVRFDASEVVPYTVRENTAGDMAIYTSIDSNEVPAGTGVLLISETGATSATATIISSAAAVENNELTGHYLAGEVASALVLNSVGGQVGFYSLAAGSTLAANRAFLGNSSGSIRGLQLVAAGAATGIQNVETKAQNAKIYDLQGRRVQNAQKGLYIVNGKKVIL